MSTKSLYQNEEGVRCRRFDSAVSAAERLGYAPSSRPASCPPENSAPIPHFDTGSKIKQIAGVVLLALLAVFGTGCVTEQYAEFRGTFGRGVAGTNSPSVLPSGSEFALREDSLPDAMSGFGVSTGAVIFVYDRQKYVGHHYRLSNDAVSAVYFSDLNIWNSGRNGFEEKFLSRDMAARDQTEGIHRLHGAFDVKRWKSNVDFRVQLAMRSTEPDPMVMDGVLVASDRVRFRPKEWLGKILMTPFLMFQ